MDADSNHPRKWTNNSRLETTTSRIRRHHKKAIQPAPVNTRIPATGVGNGLPVPLLPALDAPALLAPSVVLVGSGGSDATMGETVGSDASVLGGKVVGLFVVGAQQDAPANDVR